MVKKYNINEINNINIDIKTGDIIFLYGDLASGKTTLSKHIINNILKVEESVTSPTYTYYNKYGNIYHFDLYRLKNYDEFFAIGGEDILTNSSDYICIIEWPEIIEKYFEPNIKIYLNKVSIDNEREIDIKYLQNNI